MQANNKNLSFRAVLKQQSGSTQEIIRMPTNNLGFTLVELAIALMVIGLLIGGVLKGQELIENARVTAFVRDIKSFDTAALIFRNTYGAWPGDIKRPNRIPNCNTNDDSICGIGGNGNGKVLLYDTTPNFIEDYNFFPHMVKAGMLQGPLGGTQEQMDAVRNSSDYISTPEYELFFPILKMGGFNGGYVFDYDQAYYIAAHEKEMAKIDSKMDDGLPRSGSIRAEDCSLTLIDGVYHYNLETNDGYCMTWIASESLSHKWAN